MSAAADSQRSVRQHWAAPGGSHDRMIGVLKKGLPVAVGLLAAVLATAPFTHDTEVSFLLDKNKVDVASERMKVTEALYRGEDAKGQPFSLRAGSALQKSSREPIVQLKDLEARLQIDGQASVVSAQKGLYDIEKERVGVNGPLQFQAEDGYRFTTRDVAIDLKTRRLASENRVDGRMPIGTFGADRMQADLSARTVTLQGRARLHIDQNGLRAKK
ncbi:LPS export ABC transporter periplasmic protein LptC [Sphingobium sufflavum]|uniref:LPS export ABC transporter periplasmic protein LptC n=1 Tax=Sphingobium sufflavum TaxID=1129547 RepID=UPI001F318587|nr:LPS export ABC transporter periplasmic protein LptC [Sphingobium sufflavum]MCE7795956.1 LPS export ABC transporter periplasmic protein LptC [Sphingobium sufflavum]